MPVSIFELECNLWVCASESDGASPTRLFYQLYSDLVEPDSEVVNYAPNLFAPSRKIYFF